MNEKGSANCSWEDDTTCCLDVGWHSCVAVRSHPLLSTLSANLLLIQCALSTKRCSAGTDVNNCWLPVSTFYKIKKQRTQKVHGDWQQSSCSERPDMSLCPGKFDWPHWENVALVEFLPKECRNSNYRNTLGMDHLLQHMLGQRCWRIRATNQQSYHQEVTACYSSHDEAGISLCFLDTHTPQKSYISLRIKIRMTLRMTISRRSSLVVKTTMVIA